MGRTIVQEYGPIYGEPVNGTVQGRPNGSVFVPLSNVITLTMNPEDTYIRYFPGQPTWLTVCDSAGGTSINDDQVFSAVAVAQDLASNIRIQVYSDSDLNTLIAYRDFTAGDFNNYVRNVYNAVAAAFSNGDPLYVRAQLMNNGTAVATSNVVEVTGWSA